MYQETHTISSHPHLSSECVKTSLKLEMTQPHNQMTSKSFVIRTSLHYLCQKCAFAPPVSKPTSPEGDTSEVDRPRSSFNQWSHTFVSKGFHCWCTCDRDMVIICFTCHQSLCQWSTIELVVTVHTGFNVCDLVF